MWKLRRNDKIGECEVKITLIENRAHLLGAIRDTLLRMLLSGELRVKDTDFFLRHHCNDTTA